MQDNGRLTANGTARERKERESAAPAARVRIDLNEELNHLLERWRESLQGDADSGGVDPSSTTASLFYRPRPGLDLRPGELPDLSTFRAGDVLGEFRLTRLIAGGGMGQVWQARQLDLQRDVALKFIRADRLSSTTLRYFLREGRAGGRINHPSIVSIFAMGKENSIPWIAQEYVEGECTFGDFLEWAKDDGPLPADYDRRLALFLYQVADAMQAAHDAGIVHRDLKPANILVARGDVPKITDFGLARIEDDGALSQPAPMQGTVGFMSPEQVVGASERIGGRSDVFSLGAVLYQALTFEPAFRDLESQMSTLLEGQGPALPRTVRPGVDLDLEAICLKALEPRPQDRYPTMRALADDLARLLEGLPVKARPVGPWQRVRKWRRRNPAQTAAAAIALAAAAVISLLFVLLGRAGAEADHALWRGYIKDLRYAVDRGQHERAEGYLSQADAILPDRPDGALHLASGLAQACRYREAEDWVRVALERGYEPDADAGESAEAWYHRGLYLMTVGRVPAYGEARESFERAADLEPSLQGVWLPLYQVRKVLGDADGAIQALDQYLLGLDIGDPYALVIRALLHEMRGELAAAIDLLGALLEDPSDEAQWLLEGPFNRHLGRVLLASGQHDDAEEYLRRAVAAEERDNDAWVNLALLHLERAESRASPEESSVELARAEVAAIRALDLKPGLPDACELLAHVLVRRRELADPADPLLEDLITQALRAIEALETADPESLVSELLRAQLHFLEGRDDRGRGWYPQARGSFERCLELDPYHVPAAGLLAHDLFYEDSWAEALAVSDEAWNAIVMGGEPFRGGPQWLQVLMVYRFGAASALELGDVAEEARDALEEHLVDTPFVSDAERVTYAEFLAVSRLPNVKDCGRAMELLDEFFERVGRNRASWPSAFVETIEIILDACDG